MEGDVTQNEKAYWTKDVGDILGMAVTTVRKYASKMENNGYSFIRNEHNQRAFLERDVILMKRIQSLSKTHGVTLDDAVHAVLKDVPHNKAQTVSPPDTKQNEQLQAFMTRLITRYDDKFDEIKNDNEELKGMIQDLHRVIEGQQSYIDELRKQNEQTWQSFNELQQARTETASAEKKGFFSRFFKS